MDGNTAVDNKTCVVQQFSAEFVQHDPVMEPLFTVYCFFYGKGKEYLRSTKSVSGKGGICNYDVSINLCLFKVLFGKRTKTSYTLLPSPIKEPLSADVRIMCCRLLTCIMLHAYIKRIKSLFYKTNQLYTWVYI